MDTYSIAEFELKLTESGKKLEVWKTQNPPPIPEETYNLELETIRVKIEQEEYQLGQDSCSGCFSSNWDLDPDYNETLTFDGANARLTGVTDYRIEARTGKPQGVYSYQIEDCEVHLHFVNGMLKVYSPCDPPCEEAMSGCLVIDPAE